MRVLVACEFSGRVRDAFRARGHDAWSCDILPTESDPAYHIQADVLTVLDQNWDLMIAHPPCTHLAVSGARWFAGKEELQEQAIRFVLKLFQAPIKRIAVENPVGILHTRFMQPHQTIQPWQFGHGECKATCLWLHNLPLLQPTQVVPGRKNSVHHAADTPQRWKVRSRTYPGIATAMAEQWGCL